MRLELRAPPGNRLEVLSGDRTGQHSIRINDQYRICFVCAEKGPEQVGLWITTDFSEGKKMVRIPTDRPPTHPGEMLLEEFLLPMGISQRDLADAIRVPYQRINEVINGRRGITPATALRLAKFFGVSADFWMNLQLRWDLYHAQASEKDVLKAIRRHTQVSPS